MSNYLYFFKSFKNDKSIYKKVIILSIAIILLIIVFSFTKSMNMYIENGIKQDLSYKTLYIDPDSNTNSISLINKIKEIKHVSDAFIDNYSDITVYSNDFIKNGSIQLVRYSENDSINYISFNGVNLENQIICPKNFYPKNNIDNINKKDIIKMNKYLNKNIDIYYYTYNNDESKNVNYDTLKIVGIYDNNTNIIDENICYAHKNLIEKIYNKSYENYNQDNITPSIFIRVDNIKNIDFVKEKLNDLGYESSSLVLINSKFINFVNVASFLIGIFIILFLIIIINFINKKNISDKSKIINLYRCFGYTKNDITKILYIENGYISLISICISIIFTFLIFIILKITIYYNPFLFSKFPIIYNYFAIIISLIIIFVINIYNIKFVRKNILGDL